MKKGQRDRSLLTCSKWDTCSRHPERTAVGSDRPKGTKDFGASLEAAFSSTGKRNLPWALLPDAEMATEIPFLPEDATNDAERGLSERYPAQYLWFCLADKIPHVNLRYCRWHRLIPNRYRLCTAAHSTRHSATCGGLLRVHVSS